tara:strand:+ start:2129 stop:2446 length:318 start_codon:yes stop_codon:yes gene_type:complete
MTQKKATPREESSLNNSQAHYNTHNTHVTYLGKLITKQLEVSSNPMTFALLIERLKAAGFTRSEIISQFNRLIAEGVIAYREGVDYRMPSLPKVEFRVELLEVAE